MLHVWAFRFTHITRSLGINIIEIILNFTDEFFWPVFVIKIFRLRSLWLKNLIYQQNILYNMYLLVK